MKSESHEGSDGHEDTFENGVCKIIAIELCTNMLDIAHPIEVITQFNQVIEHNLFWTK